jgi:hypothetical protein
MDNSVGIETSMHRRVRTAIIGADPSGLSVAAHAPDAVVFRASMQIWRTDIKAGSGRPPGLS